MSGTNFVFNIAKGKAAYYAGLPAANDALIAVALVATGLVADATLADYDDLAALLGGASDECAASGYARATLGTVTVTVDDGNDRVDLDSADISLGTIAAGATIAKVVICYDPDTTTGTDSTLVPISAHSFDVTTDGSEVVATVANFARAA